MTHDESARIKAQCRRAERVTRFGGVEKSAPIYLGYSANSQRRLNETCFLFSFVKENLRSFQRTRKLEIRLKTMERGNKNMKRKNKIKEYANETRKILLEIKTRNEGN